MSGENENDIKVSVGPQGLCAGVNESEARPSRQSLPVERRLLSKMLSSLGSPPLSFLLWDGREVGTQTSDGTHQQLGILDRGALWRLLIHPEYQFPEMYTQGRLQVPGDLEPVMQIVQYARRNLDPNSLLRRVMNALFRARPGSQAHAKDNISSHYDLGNDFYRLWLDQQMVYTCAYFPSPDMSLEQAQVAKMDHVCRKLRLRPGESVVEAGCGWGALALHMAKHYGVRVRAFNISKSQLEWARARAQSEGLSDRVEFIDGDYREINGRCDAFVSVGMLEHVGPRHYPDLGATMHRCLEADGRGLIHTIGLDRPGPLNVWIERRIFPGARPPSLGEMMPLFGPYNFSVLDVENLRLHYAMTLDHWLRRFEVAREQVSEMFDPEFVRAWRFYLAGSKASFTAGHMQLFQVLFSRKGHNRIPWTRSYLYRDDEE